MWTDAVVSELAHAIERVVSASPSSFIATLVRELRSAPAEVGSDRFAFTDIGTPADALLASLVASWRNEPRVDAAALAIALEAAAAARATASSTVELVWTGPTTESASALNTTAVLFRIIRHARERLALMSFSAYPIFGLLDELVAACERGVAVRLILESALESGGTLTVDAAKPFALLKGRADFYVWPHALRAPGASMHAKVAVADGSVALVTSANLTERGVDSNLELGTYFEGNAVPAEIERRLDELITRGTLVLVA
jgi:phosphatidylserine/phosphatidylglycerophosphate/cardiolipin synthase-like enzyme